MKIVVCVKQVAVVDDEISFADDGRLAPESVDLALNEWDACAVEEGLVIRDAASSGEVLAVTVGPPSAWDALVRCLAMGCDRATRVDADNVVDPLDPIALAHALADVVRDEKPELVLCGAQSSDAGHGATRDSPRRTSRSRPRGRRETHRLQARRLAAAGPPRVRGRPG